MGKILGLGSKIIQYELITHNNRYIIIFIVKKNYHWSEFKIAYTILLEF